MKGQVNDGGPAFPVNETSVRERLGNNAGETLHNIQHQGLSLRAYAAIAVLPSVILVNDTQGLDLRFEKDAARIAVDYADALLEELGA